MAKIHDRMPVILPESAWDTWLDRDNDDLELLGKLLVPADPALTVLRPISTEVNNVRHDGAELLAEVDTSAPAEGTLLGARAWHAGDPEIGRETCRGRVCAKG